MTPLTDTSICPFGKYKGRPMSDVPVFWLHYMWTKCNFSNIKREDTPHKSHQINAYLVAMYIRDNIDALKMEDEDKIW